LVVSGESRKCAPRAGAVRSLTVIPRGIHPARRYPAGTPRGPEDGTMPSRRTMESVADYPGGNQPNRFVNNFFASLGATRSDNLFD
jgi:hypothetical protein